ncbi:MAG TPA: hypothetical protein VIM41_14720 [Gammaproteobacteria bacterium]
MLMKIFSALYIGIFFAVSAHASQTMTVDDNSFSVFYESPMNADKGLILYISNNNCTGSYRITTNDLVIASGEINGRGPSKLVHFGNVRLRVDCGPAQVLTLTPE